MIDKSIPIIKITKHTPPIIYLDTNVLIEFSRYEKGCCTDIHISTIKELYHLLEDLKQEKRILCARGNQLEEMGASKSRKDGREFLHRFTNVGLKLPFQIRKDQLESGYQGFASNDTIITFNAVEIIEKTIGVNNTSIELYGVSTHSKDQVEEFKKDKEELAAMLNDVKNNGMIAANYDAQLDLELKADYQVFRHYLAHYDDSPESHMNMLDSIATAFACVGINPLNVSDDICKAIDNYTSFLVSSYHHSLPYVWIRSVLFAHIIQRQKKIIPSDNLDIKWASAYLPFVDYVATDGAFCKLLNESGLAESYRTKVFDFSTIGDLVDELRK